MKNFLEKLNWSDIKENFELYLGGIFISVTVVIVIVNVFTRYVLGFTVPWAEEVPVLCFVWTIFLGSAGAFKHKRLIGVDFLLQTTRGKMRDLVFVISDVLVFVISVALAILSARYVFHSRKITSVLMISYKFVNISIVISFVLLALYSVINLIQTVQKIKNSNENKNNERGERL